MPDPGNLDETVSGVRDPMRVRRWGELRGVVTIELTRKADDEDMRVLNLVIGIVVGALEQPAVYAAAPDMLAALQRVVGSWLGDHAPRHDDWDVARAAIAKALIAQAADTSARNVPAGEGSANASRAATGPLPRIAPDAEPSAEVKP